MATKNQASLLYAKHALVLYTYLFIVWGFYRLLFQAPVILEELLIKPLAWFLPLAFLLSLEKAKLSSIGIVFNNLFKVVYFVIGLGVIFSAFAILVNYLKYNNVNFEANLGEVSFGWAIGLSFITAIVEEVTFRGYLLTRLMSFVRDQTHATIIISVGWTLIHLPIAIFDWKLEPLPLLVYVVVIFLFSVGTTFVFLRTRNIIAPILLHVLWQWPIILFR